jgi:hypothetical protein
MFSRFVVCLISGLYIIGCSGLAATERPPNLAQDASSSPQSNPISAQSSAPSGCAPAVPQPEGRSPYAGYSRGVPTDPSFFPIAVWLQGTWHAPKLLAEMGINIYVGNNAGVGANALTARDLQTLQALGVYAIVVKIL